MSSTAADAFVPHDFDIPQGLSEEGFRLEPLHPRHNEADHAAWMSSIEHIRATPGFEKHDWPPVAGMSAAENLSDLQKHADDFERRDGFTYSVLDDQDEVVGCVYIYPVNSGTEQAQVRSWVSADRADLDDPVYEAVSDWLELVWPFDQVRYRPTT